MPEKKELAILLNFFNPCNSKRILMNFLYTFNMLKAAKRPVYAIECLFPGQNPSIGFENIVQVRTKSYFFHKERLYRILEKFVPPKYTKLLFIDADLFYEEADWYEVISKSLDRHEVVQPYKIVHYLDLSYKEIIQSIESCAQNSGDKHDVRYQVGMAWAMTRDYYRRCGFFDHCVIGNGDLLSAVHFTSKKLDNTNSIITRLHKETYAEYTAKPKPTSYGHVDLTINHLYHGSLTNRKYWDRNFIFKEIAVDLSYLIRMNDDGVFEWRSEEDNKKWNPILLQHFTERKDDDFYDDIAVDVNLSLVYKAKKPAPPS